MYINTGKENKKINLNFSVNFFYLRDQLQENISKEIYKMEFDQDDIMAENQELGNYLQHFPAKAIPLVSFIIY